MAIVALLTAFYRVLTRYDARALRRRTTVLRELSATNIAADRIEQLITRPAFSSGEQGN
jgi:hypothetical protein